MTPRARPGRTALVGLALVVVTAVACSDSTLDVGGALTLTLRADPVVALDDSLVVEYDVTGQRLLGMELRFGDGALDSLSFSGAQSAGGRIAHRYLETGVYTVVGRVQDALQGHIMDELTVTVTPP